MTSHLLAAKPFQNLSFPNILYTYLVPKVCKLMLIRSLGANENPQIFQRRAARSELAAVRGGASSPLLATGTSNFWWAFWVPLKGVMQGCIRIPTYIGIHINGSWSSVGVTLAHLFLHCPGWTFSPFFHLFHGSGVGMGSNPSSSVVTAPLLRMINNKNGDFRRITQESFLRFSFDGSSKNPRLRINIYARGRMMQKHRGRKLAKGSRKVQKSVPTTSLVAWHSWTVAHA